MIAFRCHFDAFHRAFSTVPDVLFVPGFERHTPQRRETPSCSRPGASWRVLAVFWGDTRASLAGRASEDVRKGATPPECPGDRLWVSPRGRKRGVCLPTAPPLFVESPPPLAPAPNRFPLAPSPVHKARAYMLYSTPTTALSTPTHHHPSTKRKVFPNQADALLSRRFALKGFVPDSESFLRW